MHDRSTTHRGGPPSYPVSSCRIEGDALGVSRPGSASVSMPMAEIRSMTFFVGTRARGTWHDFVLVNASSRSVRLTSHGAVPNKVVPSRNAYRNFVLKLVKAVRAQRPNVGLFVYGEGNAANRFVAIVLFVIAALVGFIGLRVLTSEGASSGALFALFAAVGLTYVGATQMRAPAAQPIDPEREVERMVPPQDADG